jgi:hypothetical protein
VSFHTPEPFTLQQLSGPRRKRVPGWAKGLAVVVAVLALPAGCGVYALYDLTRPDPSAGLVRECRGAVSIQFDRSSSAGFEHEVAHLDHGRWAVDGQVYFTNNAGHFDHKWFHCVADDQNGLHATATLQNAP